MSGPAVIAAHQRAGRVEAVRLGLRPGEATARGVDGVAAPLLEAPLAVGATRIGGLEVALEIASNGPVARLTTRITNPTRAAVPIAALVLGMRWTPPGGTGSLRFLRNGWQSWSFNGALALDDEGTPPFPSGPWLRGLHHAVGSPPADRAGWHESHTLTAVGDGQAACVAGALERGRSFGVAYLRRDGDAVRVEVELRIDGSLAPGASWDLEPVRVALGPEANALLEDHAVEHGRDAGARASAPFVAGWCSWYHYFHDVTEDDVLRNLEALVALRDEIPIEVVQIDDGYQREVGDWLETNDKFPRGLAPLASDVGSAGFTPGLWTAPFCAVPASHVARDHPDWLLRDGDAPLLGLLHPVWSPDGRVHVLDPGHDAVVDHLGRLFGELVSMGFVYLKLDFLYAAAMQAISAAPDLPRAARLRRGLDAVRRGAGEEAFLLGCGCPLGAAVGVVDGMRIGPDVAPSWRAGDALAIPGLEETTPSTRSAVRSALTRAWMHRRLWLNDPDCLMARAESALTDAETRTLAAVIAGTGGMTVFSDDVTRLDPARRRLVADTIDVARRVDGLGLPGAARALPLLDGPFPRFVSAPDADTGVLAVVQASDGDAVVDLSRDDVGIGSGALLEAPLPRLGTKAPESRAEGFRFALAEHESALVELRRDVPLMVFCDFDGTFSVQDVGSTLAQRHAGAERPKVWERFERGEISAWDYNMTVLDGLRLPKTVVDEFLGTVDLDPGARDLLSWCEARGVPFRVLSDGFDANLNRLQEIHGVRFAYDANHLRYDRGHWRIAPGHPNPACGCGTGTCKRGRIQAARRLRPDAVLVHVGNGRVSDLCGALEADVAFAKDSLAVWLEQRGEPFERFETLSDVIPRLEGVLADRLPGASRAR